MSLPPPNLLDRVIGYVSPVRAARRMQARAVMSIAGGYLGARRDRPQTKLWRTGLNSADSDTLPDLATLRDRSRDLVRNAPLACGAVGTVVQNVIATGLSLQARPDREVLGFSDDQASEWSATVEREFLLWAESAECDITRTQNFYGLQELAFRSALESGDVFALLPFVKSKDSPYSLRVQVIEADRCETPRGEREKEEGAGISGGVERDANGAPVAYHFLKRHPGSIDGRSRDYRRVLAFGERSGRRNVIHLYDRLRPGQSRGVPFLAPVIETFKQLDKYTEAEVGAAVVASLFTVFVKTENGSGLGSQPGQSMTSDEEGSEVQLGSGSIIDLLPGEDVEMASPGRPNSMFEEFVLAVLRQTGTALGLPFEVLVKHFTSSYSASRAAMLDAWRFFRNRREFMAMRFCDPVYRAFMEEAVATGRIDAPGFFDDPVLRAAYLKTEWIGDSPGHVDPYKEVQAAKARVDMGVSSLQIETLWLTGQTWEEVHRQQVREKEARQRDGLAGSPPPSPDSEPPAAPVPPDPDEDPDQPDEDERREAA